MQEKTGYRRGNFIFYPAAQLMIDRRYSAQVSIWQDKGVEAPRETFLKELGYFDTEVAALEHAKAVAEKWVGENS